MAEFNFLEPSINSIRKSIQGIDDSYNNFWDILAELVQNSVDAIKRKNSEERIIDIKVDCISKEIRIYDNGCGIKYENIPNLLRPFSTDKEKEFDSIGEKGVGLKFVIFQSNEFFMQTYAEGSQAACVRILDAKNWKNSKQESYPKSEIDKIDLNSSGTEIILKGLDQSELFELDYKSIKFILRTKTAIGNTDFIWKESNKYRITLEVIDINGVHTKEEIPFKYWLPIEIIPKKDIIDLDEFKAWCKEEDRQDVEKRNKLKNKIITYKNTIMHSGNREINYWACFVPRRSIWDEISLKEGLLSEEMRDNEQIMYDKIFSIHQPGIYTSVKGMPTGIVIDHPNTGYAGYWANIFIIFEDKNLRFDIGRKSINGNVKNIYREHSKEIFAEFLKYVTKYVSGEPDFNENSQWNRDEIFLEISKMVDLNDDKINFKKNAIDQEASVAAIFFELIGMKKFGELHPLISGYRNKYDLYAEWKSHNLVIEFKSHLRNIAKDFSDVRKLFDEINYIICWDVNDEDKNKLHDLSMEIVEIEESFFEESNNDKYLPMTTHKLMLSPATNPIYVIDLKKFLKTL